MIFCSEIKAFSITGVEEATVVTIAVELANSAKEAIQAYGDAIAYSKAKTNGPDADDRSVAYDIDRDRGLDWSLDVDAAAEASNAVDDGEETPYTPGMFHSAWGKLHYQSVGGQWVPNPIETVGSKKQEYYGYAAANPEDDPVSSQDKTAAASVAAFSASGTTVDFKFGASVDTTASGQIQYKNMHQIQDLSDPPFDLSYASGFMASIERFIFSENTSGQVLIQPLFSRDIDLMHSYMTQGATLYPTLRGYDPLVIEILQEGYQASLSDRLDGELYTLSATPDPNNTLTILGAGLHFNDLLLERAGKTDSQLLAEYFSNVEAVQIVAPYYAQSDYIPDVTFRYSVTGGEDVSSMVGRDYLLPYFDGDIFGIFFGVQGSIDAAVALGANTEGHFIRDIATPSWDGVSDSITFVVPGQHFFVEGINTNSDLVAVPEPGTLSFVALGVVLLLVKTLAGRCRKLT